MPEAEDSGCCKNLTAGARISTSTSLIDDIRMCSAYRLHEGFTARSSMLYPLRPQPLLIDDIRVCSAYTLHEGLAAAAGA